MHISIDKNSDVSIYRQLTDSISAMIISGELEPGYRLPTVRELSKQLDIAQGTVKHAYDWLTSGGFIEMTRGRGTFVKATSSSNYSMPASQPFSREARAMAAIENLLDEM